MCIQKQRFESLCFQIQGSRTSEASMKQAIERISLFEYWIIDNRNSLRHHVGQAFLCQMSFPPYDLRRLSGQDGYSIGLRRLYRAVATTPCVGMDLHVVSPKDPPHITHKRLGSCDAHVTNDHQRLGGLESSDSYPGTLVQFLRDFPAIKW